MKKFALLATIFAVAVLLLPALASAQYISVSPASPNLGEMYIGRTYAARLTITNVTTSNTESFLEINITASSGSFTASATTTGQPVRSFTDMTVLWLPFSQTTLSPAQSEPVTIYITPSAPGAISLTAEFVGQNGGSTYPIVNISGTAVFYQEASVDFLKGTETIGADGSVAIRMLSNWSVIWPADIVWTISGNGFSATYSDMHPAVVLPKAGEYAVKLQMTDGRNGKVYSVEKQVIFPNPQYPDPEPITRPADIPPPPPKPSIEASTRVVSEKAGGRSEKHLGGYWSGAGKPLAGIQSESWGEIKNQ